MDILVATILIIVGIFVRVVGDDDDDELMLIID